MNKTINKVIIFTSGLLIASPMIGANTFNYSSDDPVLNQLKAIPFQNPSDGNMTGVDGVFSEVVSNGKLFTFFKKNQTPANQFNIYITPINGVGETKKLTIVVTDPLVTYFPTAQLSSIIISKDGQHFIASTNSFGYIVGDTTTAKQTLNVNHIYSGDASMVANLKMILSLRSDGTNINAFIAGKVNATQHGNYIFSFPIADCFTNKVTLDKNFQDAGFNTTKKIFIAPHKGINDYFRPEQFEIFNNKAYALTKIKDPKDASKFIQQLWIANLADAKADISTPGKAVAKKIDISSFIDDEFKANSIYINTNKVFMSVYDVSTPTTTNKFRLPKIYDITSGTLVIDNDPLSGTLVDSAGWSSDSYKQFVVSSEITLNGYTLISGDYMGSSIQTSPSALPILRTPEGEFILQKYFNSLNVYLNTKDSWTSYPLMPKLYTDESPVTSTSNIVSVGKFIKPAGENADSDLVTFYKFNIDNWKSIPVPIEPIPEPIQPIEPIPEPIQPIPDKSGSSSGLSTEAIVGIVIGSIAGAALIGTGIYFLGKNQGWWKANASAAPKTAAKK